MINAKKMDALEFVNSLEGGWDCIVFDPPYLDKYLHVKKKGKGSIPVKKERAIQNKEFNESVLRIILEKTNLYVILQFYNKPDLVNFDDFFIWYKGMYGGINGRMISNNAEFINIKDNLGSASSRKQIFRTIEIKIRNNQFMNSRKAFEKPVKLYKQLFRHFNIKYVLDPFAGSYNSTKACDELGIKIDTCDKYLDPPSVLNNNLKYLLE